MNRSASCDTFINFEDLLQTTKKTVQRYSDNSAFGVVHKSSGSHFLEHYANINSRTVFRRSDMSGRPVGYFAAWLLSCDQALIAEDHRVCLAAPDLETRQSAQEMVKQMREGLDLLCCERYRERDFDGCLTHCAYTLL